MFESICARSAVFHLMVLSHTSGKRFGIPYSYVQHTCRVQREDFTLYIYDLELRKVLITHDVTWSRKDSFCKGQFTDDQPEEKPSVPVKISITQKKEDPPKSAFAKFAFGGDRNECYTD